MKTGTKIITYLIGLVLIIACAGSSSANPSFASGKRKLASPSSTENLSAPAPLSEKDKELARKEREAEEKLYRANNPEISGKVVESMAGGAYTYALLEKDGKKTWVAMPETKVVIGQELVFYGGSEMRNFKSKTLGRTFEKIFFCNAPEKKIGGESDGEMAGKASVGSAGVITAVSEPIKVEKATGNSAHTVEELYTAKASLDGKEISVKGKVVKVSVGIMDKNWIHVQDGSGDPKEMTNNLVVTSQDLPKVGDIVVVNGTLRADKNFGGGYRYEVIVEEATIK